MADVSRRAFENEWYQRCLKFKDWKVSRDQGQRKVWQLWFEKLKTKEPQAAEILLNELLRSQYIQNGEVWQGTFINPKIR
ncbi:MAG: hypothetical protein SA339_08425 [Methanomassiliicoccus sp.]|nr:hypothetical protein [Methanomassiliicoccus sp.]